MAGPDQEKKASPFHLHLSYDVMQGIGVIAVLFSFGAYQLWKAGDLASSTATQSLQKNNTLPASTEQAPTSSANNCVTAVPGDNAYTLWQGMGAPPNVVFRDVGGYDATGESHLLRINQGYPDHLPGAGDFDPGDQLCK